MNMSRADQEITYVGRDLRDLFQAAQRRGDTTIEMFGVTIDLPKKLDFDTLDEMRSYINTRILGNPHIVERYGDTPYLTVTQSKYLNLSQYHPKSHSISFAMSDIGMSIDSVVHETAHVLGGSGHGDRFRVAYISIYDVIAGPMMAWAVDMLIKQKSLKR